MALVDYFLKIETVDGESQDEKHKNEIQIDSFSFGAHQTGISAAGGGGGSGKVSLQDFSFVKKVDKASVKLFLCCCTGEHLKKASLVCRKAGGGKTGGQEYWKIDMADLIVSSYTTGGPHDGVALPTDQVSINFAEIKLEYKPQKADGTLDSTAIKAGYNQKTHTVT